MDEYHFDLEIGKDYKIKEFRIYNKKGGPPKVQKVYKAKLIEINGRIAIFDTGNYRTSEMIKDCKIGRTAS